MSRALTLGLPAPLLCAALLVSGCPVAEGPDCRQATHACAAGFTCTEDDGGQFECVSDTHTADTVGSADTAGAADTVGATDTVGAADAVPTPDGEGACGIGECAGWITAASLPDARTLHTATLLDDGSVLVAGGADALDMSVSTGARYHPGSDTWTETGALVKVA
ncbi:MAG: kelch repeat-containing protein, partial [Myxococcota bacterium]|nr:kelch repeat-containing protein [Myxococcota bacterium]